MGEEGKGEGEGVGGEEGRIGGVGLSGHCASCSTSYESSGRDTEFRKVFTMCYPGVSQNSSLVEQSGCPGMSCRRCMAVHGGARCHDDSPVMR